MNVDKTKTTQFNIDGINKLPDDKPVVYKIIDKTGDNIYTGIAKRGRIKQRLSEHLPGGPDAIKGGIKVKIQQKQSILKAEQTEKSIISRSKPKFNKKGK